MLKPPACMSGQACKIQHNNWKSAGRLAAGGLTVSMLNVGVFMDKWYPLVALAAFVILSQFRLLVAHTAVLTLPPLFLLMIGFERRHDCIGHLER